MPNQERTITITDTDNLFPVGATLKRSGQIVTDNTLTVEAKIVSDDGTTYNPGWTETGASWSDVTKGRVQYDFQSGDTTEFTGAADGAVYWLWFRLKDATPEYATFPHDGRKIKLVIEKAA